MTNICAAVNAAFTAYTPSENVTEEDMKKTKLLFGLLGESEETAEPNLDAITGISGSGPAYMFTVLEALTYGGLRVGIPKDLATKGLCRDDDRGSKTCFGNRKTSSGTERWCGYPWWYHYRRAL